jgi:hypothetical protein
MLIDIILTYFFIISHPLPRSSFVDLRPDFPKVYDQQMTNSCVAQSIASIVSFYEKKDISRNDLYFQSRENKNTDDGVYMNKALHVLEKEKICTEKQWPFHERTMLKTPPSECILKRQKYNYKTYKIPSSSSFISYKIRQHIPVIIACFLTPTFENSDKTTPSKKEEIISKHAMVVVGVSEYDKTYILRNSWSSNWKENGHIIVSKDFINTFVKESYILIQIPITSNNENNK